ncbi:hypothetical protein JVW25_24680, partial [Vibrio cholerae O1]|nr:hypothetical protein [Vibrio cholerae O1]
MLKLKRGCFFILFKLKEEEIISFLELKYPEKEFEYGRLLVDKGAQSVIVSLGGDGAIYIDKEISIKAVNPQGKVVNTVGSG